MKDTKKKDKCYLQLKLDWCDLDIEKNIEDEVNKFNKMMIEKG